MILKQSIHKNVAYFLLKKMKIIIYGAGLLLLIMTALPLFKSDFWLFRIFDYPRFQILVLLLITTAAGVIFLNRTSITPIIFYVFCGAAIVYQAVLIIRYTPIYKNEVIHIEDVDSSNTISLLISNVLMENQRYKDLIDLIDKMQPDIVIAVETDKTWMNQLAVLKDNYPYTVLYPLSNTYGMLCYSKLELIDHKVKFIIKESVPSIETIVKLPSGKKVMLYALHPEPPVPGEAESSAERDAEIVIAGKTSKETGYPVIIAGDLNDVAWSHTTRLFQRLSGLLDPRVGRGFYNTFNAKYPFFRWPLDHIFHSDDFGLVELEVLPEIGSDHFPVYIKLQINSTAEKEQEQKQPESDDHEEAEKTIKQVK